MERRILDCIFVIYISINNTMWESYKWFLKCYNTTVLINRNHLNEYFTLLFIWFSCSEDCIWLLCYLHRTSTFCVSLECTIKVKNLWTNGKICAKVPFPRYTENVKFRFQSRETASKRKPYRGLSTR